MKEPETSNLEAYTIEVKQLKVAGVSKKDLSGSERMAIRCKRCSHEFDSTFTAEELAILSNDQNESGTLHLCPECGQLSIYLLRDYFQSQES
jgi:DNA-directed RNA polymerase subunit RPC12/RpoP